MFSVDALCGTHTILRSCEPATIEHVSHLQFKLVKICENYSKTGWCYMKKTFSSTAVYDNNEDFNVGCYWVFGEWARLCLLNIFILIMYISIVLLSLDFLSFHKPRWRIAPNLSELTIRIQVYSQFAYCPSYSYYFHSCHFSSLAFELNSFTRA